jgi:hypothetical protein
VDGSGKRWTADTIEDDHLLNIIKNVNKNFEMMPKNTRWLLREAARREILDLLPVTHQTKAYDTLTKKMGWPNRRAARLCAVAKFKKLAQVGKPSGPPSKYMFKPKKVGGAHDRVREALAIYDDLPERGDGPSTIRDFEAFRSFLTRLPLEDLQAIAKMRSIAVTDTPQEQRNLIMAKRSKALLKHYTAPNEDRLVLDEHTDWTRFEMWIVSLDRQKQKQIYRELNYKPASDAWASSPFNFTKIARLVVEDEGSLTLFIPENTPPFQENKKMADQDDRRERLKSLPYEQLLEIAAKAEEDLAVAKEVLRETRSTLEVALDAAQEGAGAIGYGMGMAAIAVPNKEAAGWLLERLPEEWRDKVWVQDGMLFVPPGFMLALAELGPHFGLPIPEGGRRFVKAASLMGLSEAGRETTTDVLAEFWALMMPMWAMYEMAGRSPAAQQFLDRDISKDLDEAREAEKAKEPELQAVNGGQNG